mgnify:CR=1 FL=1
MYDKKEKCQWQMVKDINRVGNRERFEFLEVYRLEIAFPFCIPLKKGGMCILENG